MSQMIQRKQTKRFQFKPPFVLSVLTLTLSLWPQPKIAQAQWTDNGSNLTTSDNVGIGTSNPSRKLDLVGDIGGLSFEAGTGSPNSGAIRFGDNTGWKLHFGRSRETPSGSFNSGTAGVLMTIQDNGNVGIGTMEPGARLHVYGNGNQSGGILGLRSTSGGGDGSIAFLGPYAYINSDSPGDSYWSWGHRYDGDANAWVRTYPGLPLVQTRLDSGGNFRVSTDTSSTSSPPSFLDRFIVTNAGNVGIGTTTPRGTLDVNGRNSYIGTIPVALGHASSGYPGIGYNFDAQANGDWKYKVTDTAYMIGLGQSHRIDFNYAPLGTGGNLITWNTAMSIKNDGNVGIGTTEPTKKLDVRGSVGIGGNVYYGNGLTITSINPSAANHITTFQGPASGTNDVFSFELNRGGGAYGSFDISGNGATFVHFPMASLTAPGYINTPGNFYFNSGGSIGIGTSTPDSTKKLHVAGDVRIDGNIAAKYQDVAEWVTSSKAMPAGTVVMLHPDQTNQVLPSIKAYDTRVAGVISDMPGLLLGEAGDGKVKVATTGRVKVKVDATKKPVQVGDLLVTSDKEGVAMKSEPMEINGRSFHQPGTILGKALEPLKEGEGEILVLLSMQ